MKPAVPSDKPARQLAPVAPSDKPARQLAPAAPALPEGGVPPFSETVRVPVTARDERAYVVRSIRPDDEALLARFHQTLSADTVYFRYLHPMKLGARVAHERLVTICRPDPRTESVLVVAGTGEVDQIVAVGRVGRDPLAVSAEFAVVVSDACHRQGLGAALMRRLIEVARSAGVRKLVGLIHIENAAMMDLARKLGFRSSQAGNSILRAELDLEPQPPASVPAVPRHRHTRRSSRA